MQVQAGSNLSSIKKVATQNFEHESKAKQRCKSEPQKVMKMIINLVTDIRACNFEIMQLSKP